MSSRITRQSDVIKKWQNLVSALEDNIGEVQHLSTRLTKLQGILSDSIQVLQEQAAARATKQTASRRLESLLSDGEKVATFLNVGIREHYGNRSEKLAEFHLKPLRGRRPAVKTEPPPPEPELSE
jgi:DNA repair exonuclease SbcCD ATPase subunit